MEVADDISRLIVQRVDASVIKQKAIELGMSVLGMDGIRNIRSGLTSVEEVMSVAYVEEAVEE
jgi:type IV pilus assembly protein PilB